MGTQSDHATESVDSVFREAISLLGEGRLDEAARFYRSILDRDPDHREALYHLGRIRARQGAADEAVGLIGAALKRHPPDPEAHFHLATALAALGRLAEAAEEYRKALSAAPDFVEAHNNLGNVLLALGRPGDAVPHYEAALASRPGYAEAHLNLAIALVALNRPDEAIVQCDRALAIRPGFAQALNTRGNALLALGRASEAIASYESTLAADPRYAEAYHNLGAALEIAGEPDAARLAYRTAIGFAPRQAKFHHSLARVLRFRAGDDALAALESLAHDMPSFAETDQIYLNFALGKAYEDIGNYELSFRHLLAGNVLTRRRIDYDERANLDAFARIAATFSETFLARDPASGDPSAAPIFIVGMPRSGTSLIEQILASHPCVFGAGEINDFERCIVDVLGRDLTLRSFPEWVGATTGQDLGRLGRSYVDRIRAIAPQAARITNKTPLNFLLLGLIHLALPNARIIHAMRDPADACFSCFATLFTEAQPFAYDLGELGRYARGYEALMDHWRRVLPPNVMLDVRYETLTGDFESEARRIVAHCGVEWDPSCLAFHKTRRTVATASAVQVRQPLYRTSVGRAGAYGERLRPLLDALEG